MGRHASFNYPYGGYSAYPNQSENHQYQNENYFEIRKNKSSGDLISTHDDYRYHKDKDMGKRSRDLIRPVDSARDRNG